MNEEWKPICYFEHYEVSNHGRVRSTKKGMILKPMSHYKGHLFVHLSKGNKKKKFFVHRLVAIHFIINPYKKEVVNHKDEDKKNNHIDNLEWMTSGENTRYSMPSRKKKCKCGSYGCSYSCVLCRSHVPVGLGEHYCNGK